jgi:diguanylate cyclase (GGDEF)-like protein
MNEDVHPIEIPRPAMLESTGSDGPTCPVSIGSVAARNRGVLVRMSGADTGRVHPLVGDLWTLGRGRSCAVRFDDVTLSRVHARIVKEGRDYVIEDAGSLNGTWVCDARVTRAVLGDGARVRLGTGASMRFQIVDAEEERALVRMYESAVRDGLTGALNRRNLDERLAVEIASAARRGAPLSVVLFDLDHFKQVNDTHGHLAGDAVLKRAVKLATAAARPDDVVGRYGGEEFVIIARGAPLAEAAELAERLRAAIADAEVPYGDVALRVTASFGVASLACVGPGADPAGLFACADARLYAAKAAGRDRVTAA